MKHVTRTSVLAFGAAAAVVLCASREGVAVAAPQNGEPAGKWTGKTAEGFTLPDVNGKRVDVGKALGTKPVVLVFYRGVW